MPSIETCDFPMSASNTVRSHSYTRLWEWQRSSHRKFVLTSSGLGLSPAVTPITCVNISRDATPNELVPLAMIMML